MININRILKKDVIYKYDSNLKQFIIKEDEPKSKIKKIKIHSEENNAVCFKLDCRKQKVASNYINNEIEGLASGCDCIIFYSNNGRNLIIFVELKSNNFRDENVSNKYKASKSFSKYLLSLNEEFFNSSSYPIPDLKYVLFTTKPIAQTNPSRPINIKIKKFNVKQFYVDGSGERTINIGELIK
jgi:hypothetical protein